MPKKHGLTVKQLSFHHSISGRVALTGHIFQMVIVRKNPKKLRAHQQSALDACADGFEITLIMGR